MVLLQLPQRCARPFPGGWSGPWARAIHDGHAQVRARLDPLLRDLMQGTAGMRDSYGKRIQQDAAAQGPPAAASGATPTCPNPILRAASGKAETGKRKKGAQELAQDAARAAAAKQVKQAKKSAKGRAMPNPAAGAAGACTV